MIVRRSVATIIGVAVAIGLIAALEWLDGRLYGIPDLDPDRATMAAELAALPLGAKAIVAVEGLPAVFAGAWLALRIADWRPSAWIVAGLIALAGLFNGFALPQPLWVDACTVLLPWLGGWAALKAHVRPYPGEPLLG